MIYTVTLNPALDKTVRVEGFAVGAVNRITGLRTDPGGKGINVSKVIAALGGDSVAMGLLGGHTGRQIAAALEAAGLHCCFMQTPGETRTNLKIVDPANHTNTDVNEPGAPVQPQAMQALLDELIGAVHDGDIVVLSGSLPHGAPADTYRRWAERCRTAGARVFLDADGAPLAEGLKAAPYLVKPNDAELSRLLGRELTALDELAGAARTLLDGGVQRAVISLGARGALYAAPGEMLYAEGLKVPVGSTVGAGDSVVAALAWAEEQGLPWAEAARLSAATGAANVMCSGTQAADAAAVRELLPRVQLRRL